MSWQQVNQLTNAVVKRLKKVGIVCPIRRSKTSVSVYLDLDYGALGKLRISDHVSPDSSDYQYNLVTRSRSDALAIDLSVSGLSYADDVDRLIRSIKQDRETVVRDIGEQEYQRLITLGDEDNY